MMKFLLAFLFCASAYAEITPTNVTKTVTTAGTRVQVTSSSAEKPASIYFEALATNTGVIYIGLSDVSSTKYIARVAAGVGFGLSTDSNGAARVSGTNLRLSDFWLDAGTSGDKIQVTALPRSSN